MTRWGTSLGEQSVRPSGAGQGAASSARGLPLRPASGRRGGHRRRLPDGEPAMPLTVEATFENGVLKPAKPLPLKEHAKVRLTIEPAGDWVRRRRGCLVFKAAPRR